MKVGEVLRMLNAEGWYLVATRGSHRPQQAWTRDRCGEPSEDLAPGTLNSILKQSGLRK